MVDRRWRSGMCVLGLVCVVWCSTAKAEEPVFKVVRRYDAVEAHQGVAVDATHFYAITNRAIGKYEKLTGKRVANWVATKERPLIHLNGGTVVGNRLYCAHSNSPNKPATSSLEIWDTKTLKHIGTRSFGIYDGSLTWIERHDNAWWAVFAHYTSDFKKGTTQTDTRWTSLVKFNDDWQRQQAWVFPPEVIARFEPTSNSGGSWGPDGLVYCTGHDRPELYALKLPKAGSTLILVKTVPIENTGQEISWDRSQPGTIFAIDRKRKQVVVSRLVRKK